ncbi:MAG TPA: hypothetical protein VFJ72_11325 [Rubrobacteraceae bacterium]|nr:hypothetical protein [Rubrobacteraceae bacterium]
MTQGNQQQQGQQGQQQSQGQQAQGQQQQGQQQQQQSPVQQLASALTAIRKVQNLMELNYPQQGDAIQVQREAGDLVWNVIQQMQKQQQGS